MLDADTPRKAAPLAVDWIAAHAGAAPKRLAAIDLASGRRFTYAQMDDRVGRAAGALLAAGVAPGDRVGFLAANSTDVLEMVFGCWRIGATALALNFRLTPDELDYIVADAEPSVVFFDRSFAETALALRDRSAVRSWIETDGLGGASAYEDALKAATPVRARTVEQPLAERCLLMYSSGTTGRPKGVVITHEMMTFAAINLMIATGLSKKSVSLAVMPLFHIGGLNIFSCPAIYAGGTAAIQRQFEPEATLAALADKSLGVTHFLGVPAIYNAMKAVWERTNADLSHVECLFAGAESVPRALLDWWSARGVPLLEGYGMTESAASNCALSKSDLPHKAGSAGRPSMHVEMKVVRDDGADAAPGERGEILMRGPTVTPGYWRRPEANEESFVDGWFRSGDVGRIDEDGFVFIEDRVKDMYISGGENVYPAEVEDVLYRLDAVAEVAVVGLPDETWGETGCAFVVPKPGASVSMADVAACCEGRLARFKRPTRLEIVDALPRNATGKVLKYRLRETASDAGRRR